PRLRRTGAEAQGAYRPARVERLGELCHPFLVGAIDAACERVAQLRGERSRVVVARRRVGRHDDRAEVAQVELVDVGERRFGTVTPLGRAQARSQLLRERQQLLAVDRRLVALLAGGVLLVDRLAHGGDVARQHLLGDGAVLRGQLLEHGGAMGAPGAEPLGLGLLRLLDAWAGRPARSALRSFAVGPALAPFASPFTSRFTIAAPSTIGTLAPLAAVRAVAAVAWTSITAASLAALATHQRRRDEIVVAARAAQHFDALGLVASLRLDGRERHDRDAVEIEVGVGAQHVADLRATGNERGVDHTAGFAGTRGAPRPRSVTAVAGELDVDPARHGAPRYFTRARAPAGRSGSRPTARAGGSSTCRSTPPRRARGTSRRRRWRHAR